MLNKVNLGLILAGAVLSAAGCAAKPSSPEPPESPAPAPAPEGKRALTLAVPEMNKRLKLF
jgi:hypothetical protein